MRAGARTGNLPAVATFGKGSHNALALQFKQADAAPVISLEDVDMEVGSVTCGVVCLSVCLPVCLCVCGGGG